LYSNQKDSIVAWYHSFFEGLPQSAWKLSQNEIQTDLEADFLWDLLDLQEEAQVLDIFAGYGRHALPLARLKARLWCIDISREACEELTISSREEFLGIQVMCNDFLEATLPPAPLDAAYCMGNSFSFFDREHMQIFLAKISEALKPGGKFVAHSSMLAESVLPHFQQRTWMDIGEENEKIHYLVNSEYDVLNGVIHAEVTYFQSGNQQSHQIDQHIYTLSDLKNLYLEAGLEIKEVFSEIDGEPFQLGDEQIYILAEKIS
jgi:SAM-dependent methyltransferase